MYYHAGKKRKPMELLQNTVILLTGFLLSEMLVSTGTHQRVIDYLLGRSGNNLNALLTAVLLLSYTLSIFISHTIVVISMIPVINRIVSIAQDEDERKSAASLLYLAVTYGTNTGGMASLTGSPQNLLAIALAELYKIENRTLITFVSWLGVGLPATLMLLFLGRSTILFTAKTLHTPSLFSSGRKVPCALPHKPLRLLTSNLILVSTLSGLQFFFKPEPVFLSLNLIDLCFVTYGALFLLVAFILPKKNGQTGVMLMNLIFFLLHLAGSPLIFFSRLFRELESHIGLSLKNIYRNLELIFTFLFNSVWNRCFQEPITNLELPNTRAKLSINLILKDLPYVGITLVALTGMALYLLVTVWNVQTAMTLEDYHLTTIKSTLLYAVEMFGNRYIRLISVVLLIIFASELLSNSALILLLAPLSTDLGAQTALPPIMMLLTITIAASSASMTPLASMANTIAFGSIKKVSLRITLLPGFIMNILAAIVVAAVFSLLSALIL
ncbi:SLC13 family permease [Chlorobium ferrooxidans]|uniref:Citrate transporter-like domain-containing protein n=1 Tax=Chlorobium ferrooxidans DSM 13031 TaxID=377431 RepID=Q0YRI2_9CHLB|nr:SLC13 family permease [Chlorobium ferrooxidans]EAT58912.1 hypothetical protein CferDRAFT_0853 [Chlorobium ferrooxidans DSM 13031]